MLKSTFLKHYNDLNYKFSYFCESDQKSPFNEYLALATSTKSAFCDGMLSQYTMPSFSYLNDRSGKGTLESAVSFTKAKVASNGLFKTMSSLLFLNMVNSNVIVCSQLLA